MQMELVTDTLFEDADKRYIVWKWKPAEQRPQGAVEKVAR